MENREPIAPTAPPAKPAEEEPDDVDLILRHVSRQFPEALVRALITTPDPIVVGDWVDT